MSVVVLYEGRRKIVKLASPNSIVQDVLNDAAIYFSLNPSSCVLKHKKTILTNSQLFRFSNVPNNAIIDLVVESSNVLKSGKPAKIAFSLPNGGSVVKIIDCNLTIRDALEVLVKDGDCSSDIINGEIEIIFMRTVYSGNLLTSTLISSLGLSGESGRFLLRCGGSMGQSVNQGVATTVLSSSTDNVSSSNISKSQPLTSIGISAPISQPQQILPSSSTPLPKAKPVSVAHVENSALIAPEKALEQILAQNFDRISAPAIITIFKYFSNIVSNPMDSKYKSINLTNKVFLDNVRPVKFALEYLASVGFVSNGPTSIVYPDETTEDLKAQLQLLDGAMNQLNIPIEDRPRFIVASPSDPRMSTVELTPFDPFKSSVVRNAKQPPREEMSRTERNLNALREKRRQLEGPIDGVQRLTEVLLPRDGASVPPLQKFAQDEGFLFSEKDTSMTDRSMVIDEEVVDDDREALSLLSKSLMSTMRRAKQMEDAPLITSAMRELQQLEKDRIYTRVLVRVRFPDTVSLQGYFHPRHTIFDVYQWVVESFTAEYRNACTVELSRQKPLPQSTRGIKTARTGSESLANFFELYTSPPRRVLASDGVASLHDLNFTPAVVINLAWLIDFDLISTALENPQPAGFYLFPQLLKDSAESDTSAAFPVGQDLTMKPSAMSGSSSLGVNSKTSATSSSSAMDSSEKPSVAKVPKWFKIGR